MFLVPDTWDGLPLSDRRRDLLSIVIWYLPRSLSTFVDVEVVDELLADFSRKGGWRKIDGWLPLVDRQGFLTFRHGWANSFDLLIGFLKVREV